MSTEPRPAESAPHRRPFAAKYEYRWWGMALAVLGGLTLIGGFGAIVPAIAGTSTTNPVGSIIVGMGLSVWSVYLLRGQGTNPAIAQRKAAAAERAKAASERQAEVAAASMNEATSALIKAGSGGAAAVALRNFWETAKKNYPTDVAGAANHYLSHAGLSAASFESPSIGSVDAVQGGQVEFFRDWVIYGQTAYDIDSSTRGQVFVDGSIQVTSATVTDKKGRSKIVNTQHDMRTAQLQLSGAGWSVGIPIKPAAANEGRRLVDQLATHVETLRPQNATAADIRAMVDTILTNTGQPVAEKLKQISNLRFDRLLTDAEFESAKKRILDI